MSVDRAPSHHDPYERVKHALTTHTGYQPTRPGAEWKCPSHDDGTASLSVNRGDKGVVVKCQAGCDTRNVLAELDLTFADLFDKQAAPAERARIVETYDYVDRDGALVFQVCRKDPKAFLQRRPDGRGGWIWDTRGVDKMLYRLPKVLEAAAAGELVWVCEGEKDVHALESIGRVATTMSGGVGGGWHDTYTETLRGATVIVWADDDPPGRKHARRVKAELLAAGITASAVYSTTANDPAEHIGADRPDTDMVEMPDDPDHPGVVPPLDEVVSGAGTTGIDTTGPSDDTRSDKKSAATVLIDIAEEVYRFGVSSDGDTFAIPRQGPAVVALLRGGKSSLRAMLARQYFNRTGKAAPQQALADALLVIEGLAQEADEEELHLRVARHLGDTWLDLGDTSGRAVRINATGWSVEDQVPVLFKRTALNSALPTPVRGGDLDLLWRWLNVTVADRPLVVAWLIAVMDDDSPHPILGLFGEQGTGKTSAEKVLVSTLDPGPAPTRKPPRDGEAWITAAAGSWVVGIDNLSTVADWLSDCLCRAVTGDGDVRRKLYTDGEHHVIAFRRCIAITGIDLGAVRGDLAERLLPIELDRISDEDRLEEREMWPMWGRDHPLILGALLDLVAGVNHALPFVRLASKPRMADYARVLAAVDHVLGTNGMARYRAKQGSMATESLTGDPFITAMASVINEEFTGSSAELLEPVTPDAEKWRAPKGWPANARALTQLLRRQAPPMRKAGWTVTDDDGSNKAGVIHWTIARPEKACNPPPLDPPDPPDTDSAGMAGMAGMKYGPSQDVEPGPAPRASMAPDVADGICDFCDGLTLNQTPSGRWRHQACEAAS